MSAAALNALRERVHEDPALAHRLAAVDDAALPDAIVTLARDRGLDVTRDDVADASAAAQRDWLARWIR